MTEAEWLACEDAELMLGVLWSSAGKVAGRKERLLLCALARIVWGDLSDPRSRDAVARAEAAADEACGSEALAVAAEAARLAHERLAEAYVDALTAARGKLRRHVKAAADQAAAAAVAAWAANATPFGFLGWTTAWDTPYFHDEAREIRRLLRESPGLISEVFPCPSSPPRIKPAWLECGGGTALALARDVYDSRRFEELPVLADALEDAGCTDATILSHLRSPEPHVRGCWALDLILGKG